MGRPNQSRGHKRGIDTNRLVHSILLPAATPIANCASELHMKIRLMENFRAIFYAPYYAAQVLDFYAREGVDVQMFPSDTPGDAISHLTNNTIDLTWAGPMRVMLARDQNAGSELVAFAEVVSRDPFFLIGKCRSFNLSNLTHLRFATVSEVPTPWMCLQHDLRENGIDPAGIARISDRTMPDNYAALRDRQ